ncbi:Fcy22p [Sugiyamaella lignohabitans]|uniref:Fcy22p n=1 Tax=Sugiyamaella lignohabitans TaxID=796027 RepID=A0A167FCJ4_9ASCO|nr:Fcy22p [Sugiyamaella lignohabitans]ANB15121.1 Fcy22p [Sugiyamaella lignohabitans]
MGLRGQFEKGLWNEFNASSRSISQGIIEYLGAETKGIDRVLESDQTHGEIHHALSMWASVSMVTVTFALGTVGVSDFGMTFWDSTLTIIFFTLLGVLPCGLLALFGPKFGLRTLVASRFWCGHLGVRLFAFINCVCCIGWTVVNTISAAQLLHSVNNGGLPAWAAVFVVVSATVIISFLGYRVIHLYEKFSWIPSFAVFLVLIVQLSRSGSFSAGTMATGRAESGRVLSFGAVIFGNAAGWAVYVADYTTYMPKNTPSLRLFFYVFGGLMFPLVFTSILGAACMVASLNNEVYAEQYAKNGPGGLIYAVLVPDSLNAFGQFCVVLLGLSPIACNLPNMYSVALSAQTVWSQFARVPRAAWTIMANVIVLALSIPGYSHFDSVLSNFMDLLSYEISIYLGVFLSEHFIYRQGFKGYDGDSYNIKSRLPIGLAAIFGWVCGVAGAVVGMNEVYWVGPIAKLISDEEPGDLGIVLAFSFSLVGFTLARYFEKKHFGK